MDHFNSLAPQLSLHELVWVADSLKLLGHYTAELAIERAYLRQAVEGKEPGENVAYYRRRINDAENTLEQFAEQIFNKMKQLEGDRDAR